MPELLPTRFHEDPKEMSLLSFSVSGFTSTGEEYVDDALSLHAIKQLHGQIGEDFWSRGMHFDDLSVSARDALTLLYVLAELVFWLLFGVIRRVGGQFQLTEDNDLLEGCRLYSLGHQLAVASKLADALQHSHFVKFAQRSQETVGKFLLNNPDALTTFTDLALDKYFSCHPDYVQMMEDANKRQFGILHRRCRLICFLFLLAQEQWVQIANEHNCPIVSTPVTPSFPV